MDSLLPSYSRNGGKELIAQVPNGEYYFRATSKPWNWLWWDVVAAHQQPPLMCGSEGLILDKSEAVPPEYLQAVPPVIHRDIKSPNILLDQFMRARVADFGLSREEMVSKHASNIQRTFGYLDPEYISMRSYTKKSDFYSYGVSLFELIVGRNPLQGLMEYVELAAMNTEGKVGWEEIVGKFNDQELNEVAALAYKCVNCIRRRRPSMRDNVQALSRILKSRHNRKHKNDSSNARADEVSINMDQLEHQSPILEHHRVDSVDSTADSIDV